MASASYIMAWHELQLPWESSDQEDKKFRRILRSCLAAMLVMGIVMPLMHLPEIERLEQETLPPQLARIVLERKEIPKPAPLAEPKPKPLKEQLVPKPEPEKIKPAEPKPVPVAKPRPEPVVKAQQEASEKPKPDVSTNRIEKARKKAAASGVLQFSDELAAMRDSIDIASLTNDGVSRGESTAARIDRSVLTGRANQKSSGIQVASLSKNTGGAALSGRNSTQVRSDLAMATKAARGASAGSGHKAAGRSEEAIRRIMDRNKGAIFSIYNRALRKNPALAGKMTVQLIIEPSGKISGIKLIANELSDPALEKKLLARIRMIDFGGQPVASTTLNYSFDFLPY